jgi:hypothetical protein
MLLAISMTRFGMEASALVVRSITAAISYFARRHTIIFDLGLGLSGVVV